MKHKNPRMPRPPLSLNLLRFISYPYPYRVLAIRLLSQFFRKFRPYYYSCLFESIRIAKILGYESISVLEFGVAGGNGILALEKYAHRLSRKFGVKVEIYGFDMGDNQGLPQSNDFRDILYFWKPGAYQMDFDKLKSQLKTARLILGNVSETVSSFIAEQQPAPLGLVIIDLDYYSSTKEALRIFEGDSEYYLPRVLCYFDDLDVANDYTGELGAINDFNKSHSERKIVKTYGHFESTMYGAWNSAVFTFHDFRHPKYNSFVGHGVVAEELDL